MVLDRYEPPDDTDQRGVGGNAPCCAELPGVARRFREWREVQPQPQHAEFATRGDAVGLRQFVAQAVRQGDDRAGHASGEPFQQQEQAGFGRAEVAVKYMPVKGVDDHWHARQPGCQPPHESGFGGVGVYDVRAVLANQAV